MIFEISSVIEDYISIGDRVFLNARPGSGRTTTVAYNYQFLPQIGNETLIDFVE